MFLNNFVDLHLEVNLTGDGCYDVPVDKVNLIITDTCLIAYMYPKCLSK